jgi:hypothetical protein
MLVPLLFGRPEGDNYMLNREYHSGTSKSANQSGTWGSEAWVLIAFCVFGFAATVFFISLSQTISQAATG